MQDTASYLMPGNKRRYLFRNYSLEAFRPGPLSVVLADFAFPLS